LKKMSQKWMLQGKTNLMLKQAVKLPELQCKERSKAGLIYYVLCFFCPYKSEFTIFP